MAPLAQSTVGHPDLSYYLERGDKVGAFLAQRDLMCTSEAYNQWVMAEEPACGPSSDAYSGSPDPNLRHQAAEEYESYGSQHRGGNYSDYDSTIGYTGFATHVGQPIRYPDPEDIRHLHTLHSILPYIQPERKLNALDGQTMNIVEQDTGTVFAYHVPKKLLVLFLGRKVVTKYIRTAEREENGDWSSRPILQELRIPRGFGSKAAFRVLVSWMIRACQRQHRTMGQMRQFRVPQNTLTACTLAQILTLFGLHKDALRVDHTISKEHFTRPIFPVELEALWNCLGENNRYVCAAIKVVGQRLRVYEIGSTRQHPMWEEMVQLLEEYPPLKDRVRDLELNELYQPTFGTEWCKNLNDGPHSSNFHDAHRASGSRYRSRNGESGSSVAPGRETTSAQPDVSLKQARKAAILRIVV